MEALEQTLPLDSNVLAQEPIFEFGFSPWHTPDSNNTSWDMTEQVTNSTLTPEESRRLRRMKSNRESARRSRMRKRIHLEELTIQLDQLQAQNHDLRAELTSVLSRTSLVRHENRRLQIQAASFKRRLDEARALLSVLRRLHCVNMPQNFHAFDQGQASVLASLIA